MLQIPHDRLADAGKLRKLGLGQPGFSPVALNQLVQGDHCRFSSKELLENWVLKSKSEMTRCFYCLSGNLLQFPLRFHVSLEETKQFTAKAVIHRFNGLSVIR